MSIEEKKWAPRGAQLVLCAGAALLAIIAANVNLNPVRPAEGLSPLLSAMYAYCHSFPNANDSFLLILEWCGAFVLLIQGAKRRFDLSSLIIAVLFSLTMVLGYPIQETGTLSMLYSDPVQAVKAITCFVGYIPLAYSLVRILFAVLDSTTNNTPPAHTTGILSLLDRHPFVVPFLAILLAWTPFIVGYAPGIFMGDTDEQLCMWFGLDYPRAQMVNLISPDVTMTSHFPPIHTALFGSIFQMGLSISGNAGVGILCYTLVQTCIALLSISYAHVITLKLGAHPYARLTVLALIAFIPWYVNYAIMVTRDTIFASALLVFCMQLLVLAKQPESRRQTQTWVLLVVSGILTALFRSGGIAMVGVGLVALILFMRKDPSRQPLKASAISSCLILLVSLSVTNILYPALLIPPGNVAEMLSIPFQQTARFVKEHPGDLEDWEVEAIDAVLVYDGLDKRYVPTRSDKVKDYAASHHNSVTSEQWGNYARAYLAMGLRDPGCYALATMNNYYGYFYPSKHPAPYYPYAWSKKCMKLSEQRTGIKIHHVGNPLIKRLAEIDTAYIEVFRTMPILNLPMKSSTWMWILVLATAYALRKKLAYTAPILAILWTIALIFLAGPCNGSDYNRYVYPSAVVLPFLLIAFLPKAKQDGIPPSSS